MRQYKRGRDSSVLIDIYRKKRTDTIRSCISERVSLADSFKNSES